ncbi:MAG TPA: hypothetical protein VFA09_26030 [Ktedonobacteraceae bacterium]|nr:hypothetical protein [Ktedonobacteraceae bacterium]
MDQLVQQYGYTNPYAHRCNGASAGSSNSQLDIAEYSYTYSSSKPSGKMESGHWIPENYTSCQPNGSSLEQDSQSLAYLLDTYRQVYPNAHFELVGHSLGGLVALLGGLDYVDAHKNQPGLITKIVTIDSPLHGFSSDTLAFLGDQQLPGACHFKSLAYFGASVALRLNAIAKDKTFATGVVHILSAMGTSVYTFGNTQDCLYHLALCLPNPGNHTIAQDEESTQFVVGAFQQAFSFPIHPHDGFPAGHGAILTSTEAIKQLAYILALAPSVAISVTTPGKTTPLSVIVRVYVFSPAFGIGQVAISAQSWYTHRAPLVENVSTLDGRGLQRSLYSELPVNLAQMPSGSIEFSVDYVQQDSMHIHYMQGSNSATALYDDPHAMISHVSDYYGQTVYDYENRAVIKHWSNITPVTSNSSGGVQALDCPVVATCYMLTTTGLMMKTTDAGNDWVPVLDLSSELSSLNCGSFCAPHVFLKCFQADSCITWGYATGEGGGVVNAGFVDETSDGGGHWARLPSSSSRIPWTAVTNVQCFSQRACYFLYAESNSPNSGPHLYQSSIAGGSVVDISPSTTDPLVSFDCLDASSCIVLAARGMPENNSAGEPQQAYALWLTDNGGQSWTQSPATFTASMYNGPALFYAGSQLIVTSTEDCGFQVPCNLEASHDGGQSWIAITAANPPLATSAVCTSDRVCYLGAQGGFDITQDGGMTWQFNQVDMNTEGIQCPTAQVCYAMRNAPGSHTGTIWKGTS